MWRWADASRRLRARVDPGAEALVVLAAKTLPSDARVLVVGGPPVPALGDRRVTVTPAHEALAFLRVHTSTPFDAILVAWPSRSGPLIPLLQAVRDTLAPEGRAFVCELVWQTAPTVELLKAFAPALGHDKVRPIEGFEMQAEHSGYTVEARHALDRATWAGLLPPQQRSAVEADSRGAAKLGIWVLKPSDG
jgi:hypothetical protein